MTIRNLFPDQLPSLSLNFAKVKALDPRVTFTRASGATHVDASGTWREVSNNVPRFDHNPTTKESLGLLIEEQRTNVIRNPRSEGTTLGTLYTGLTQGAGRLPTNWSITTNANLTSELVSVTNVGALTVLQLRFVTTGNLPSNVLAIVPETVVTATAGTTYALSWFARAVSGTVPPFRFGWQDGITTTYGSTITLQSTMQRYFNTFVVSAGGTTARNNATFLLTADVTYDFVVELAVPQLELGRFATSPILPPVGTLATSTRLADAASLSGTNFSSWYRQDEGTVLIDAQTNITYVNASLFPFRFHIDDGTTTNTIVNLSRVLSGYTDQTYGVTVSSVAQAAYDTNSNNGNSKSAVAYKVNDFAFAVQGAVRSTDSVGNVPVVNQMQLGSQRGSNILNGTIRRISYYPYRVSNTDLQALTR